MKSILQRLKEDLDAKFPNIPSQHLERILNYQWEQTYKQFSHPSSTAIEVSGLGTFIVRPTKVNKELTRLYELKALHLSRLETEPDNSTVQRKLKLTEDNILYLEEKKKLLDK